MKKHVLCRSETRHPGQPQSPTPNDLQSQISDIATLAIECCLHATCEKELQDNIPSLVFTFPLLNPQLINIVAQRSPSARPEPGGRINRLTAETPPDKALGPEPRFPAPGCGRRVPRPIRFHGHRRRPEVRQVGSPSLAQPAWSPRKGESSRAVHVAGQAQK